MLRLVVIERVESGVKRGFHIPYGFVGCGRRTVFRCIHTGEVKGKVWVRDKLGECGQGIFRRVRESGQVAGNVLECDIEGVLAGTRARWNPTGPPFSFPLDGSLGSVGLGRRKGMGFKEIIKTQWAPDQSLSTYIT